jgi:hypothetical protein
MQRVQVEYLPSVGSNLLEKKIAFFAAPDFIALCQKRLCHLIGKPLKNGSEFNGLEWP